MSPDMFGPWQDRQHLERELADGYRILKILRTRLRRLRPHATPERKRARKAQRDARRANR